MPSRSNTAMKEMYVSHDECEKRSGDLQKQVNFIQTESAIIKTKLNMMIGLLGAIGAAVLSVAVKFLFS